MSRKKIQVISISILFVLLSSSFVYVGFSLILWSQNYGGVGDQSAVSIIETSDGGFAIFGNTQIEPHLSDFLLIKIDENGIMQWNQTYGRVNTEGKEDASSATSFVQTTDGGYALAGYSSFGLTYGNDYWLVKTDEQGNMEWNYTYGGPQFDLVNSLIQTSDGGFALFGTIAGQNQDYFIVKTDSQGIYMWSKIYGTWEREFGEAIVETSDGGYALAGSLEIFGHSRTAYQLLKIDSLGKMEWNQTYGFQEFEINYYLKVTDLVKTSDGGFALGGTTRSAWTNFETYYLLIKTDEFGNMQWNQTYRTANSNDKQTAMIGTSDGGFAIASSYRNEDTYSDVWLIKTDLDGIVEWNQNHSLADFQHVRSLIQTSDGGFALAGRTHSSDDEYQTNDFWILKTDEQGIPEFPSWIILPLFMMALLLVIIFKKKSFRPIPN
ncbi:hypothetical protein AC477_03230 [miscellaneous Crenarchaeota group-1 archaeon SG8-32-1]|uniref:Bulb-type lectin domain-containing protein n=1 Tax=miscellaneous Crenarchaeota group-1 archaeon SG8-32-1 TaxID=1685124 RepID=A0A0M0BUY3_9ARCH|nr:MAG: hypothetical protein AC477_03230 [miscellaneous Crenarchaeota group-1 archaeon SG8-32-1]